MSEREHGIRSTGPARQPDVTAVVEANPDRARSDVIDWPSPGHQYPDPKALNWATRSSGKSAMQQRPGSNRRQFSMMSGAVPTSAPAMASPPGADQRRLEQERVPLAQVTTASRCVHRATAAAHPTAGPGVRWGTAPSEGSPVECLAEKRDLGVIPSGFGAPDRPIVAVRPGRAPSRARRRSQHAMADDRAESEAQAIGGQRQQATARRSRRREATARPKISRLPRAS